MLRRAHVQCTPQSKPASDDAWVQLSREKCRECDGKRHDHAPKRLQRLTHDDQWDAAWRFLELSVCVVQHGETPVEATTTELLRL